jgi:hypothetical protein
LDDKLFLDAALNFKLVKMPEEAKLAYQQAAMGQIKQSSYVYYLHTYKFIFTHMMITQGFEKNSISLLKIKPKIL